MNDSKNYQASARRSAGRLASTVMLAAFATMGWSTQAHALPCLEEAYGGSVNCTSNDISVSTITVSEVLEACDGSPGDTFTFNGTLNVQPSAQNRYDIGFYIGADPQASTNDDCSVVVIPPAVTDLDGDQCGDTQGSNLVNVPVSGITAPCNDGDGDGFFDINECSSWDQNAGAVCTGPADAVPGTSSKCNCEIVPTNLVVPHCSLPEYADRCDDGNACTNDICNTVESGLGDLFGCSHTNNSDPCDDGLFCNGVDNCAAGTCSGHAGDPCANGGVCGNECNEDTDSCFVEAGTVCRASAGICDTAEECTGDNEDCPADGFLSGNTCRAADGVCDVAETCSGSSADCPADGFAQGGTCRASGGVCDVAETCNGDSPDCPADGFAQGGTCRASAGVCDVAESCSGASAACPADAFVNSEIVCRADAGECDVEETCTGSSAACPADAFESNTTPCTDDENICTADLCDGAGQCAHPPTDAACDDGIFCNGEETCQDGSCSAHSGDPCAGGGICGSTCNEEEENCFAPSTTVCRGSNGICDVAENCTGSSTTCPADSFLTSATTCRSSAGICDTAEACSGTAAACPADSFLTSATTCRASAGVCDVAEACSGTAAACPSDAFATGTTCRASAGVCDVAETCSGTSASCPANAFAASTTVCRADAGDCDVADRCTGSSAVCPANGFEPAGTSCTADSNVCTDDVCNANGECVHTNNTVNCDDGQFCTVNDKCGGGQCRGNARVCNDQIECTADSCSESLDSCVFQPRNSFCEDEEICTTDICDVNFGCRNVFSCKDICRRPGFYGKRASNSDDGGNLVQSILDAVDGIEVCGQSITETSINDSVAGLGLDSALEGLCVREAGNPQRALYRELVAAALNCAMSGSDNAEFCDDIVSDFVDVSFSDCSALCAGEIAYTESSESENLADACIRQLDCYNSGGRVAAGKCAIGTCEVTGALCGGDYGPCAPVANIPVPILQSCKRFPGNCRDEDFCQEGLGICPDKLPRTNNRPCKEAKGNDCTIDFCSIDDD